MQALEIIIPTEEDKEFALNSSRLLAGAEELKLKVPVHRHSKVGQRCGQGEEILVPLRVSHGILQLLLELAKGNAITLVPVETVLTTQDAANFLNVSRPFLIKLLSKEKVPIQRVGNRRRIAFAEVLKLKKKLMQESEAALKELAELDAKLGLE
jgi:excisionase family DNA binding protein